MSETGPSTPEQEPEQLEQRPARVRRSMFDDPVVRRMAVVAGTLVVLFLATVVGVLATGVVAPTGPRTLTEKELASTRTAVQAGSTDPAVWGAYIATLIDAGQHSRARSVLAEGRSSIEDSATAEFGIAETRLLLAEGNDSAAIEAAQQAQDQIKGVWDGEVEAGGRRAQVAQVDGLPENYYVASLLKAGAYVNLGEWEQAVEEYDIFLEEFRGAADVLVDRGNAKYEAGDAAGAEEDYRRALEFMPDSQEALDALERIGVAQ